MKKVRSSRKAKTVFGSLSGTGSIKPRTLHSSPADLHLAGTYTKHSLAVQCSFTYSDHEKCITLLDQLHKLRTCRLYTGLTSCFSTHLIKLICVHVAVVELASGHLHQMTLL